MFSRILSRVKKNDGGTMQSASSPDTHASLNARRSPSDRDSSQQVEGPRAIFFSKASSDRSRNLNSRSPTPPSTSSDSRGVFEDSRLLNLPKMTAKKSSEPNVLRAGNPRVDKMRKSNSQPALSLRKSADLRSKGKKRDDDRGFLDRAFENAVSLSFEETTDAPNERSSSDGSTTEAVPLSSPASQN